MEEKYQYAGKRFANTIGEQNPLGEWLVPQRKEEVTRTDLVFEFLVGLRFPLARLFGAQLSNLGFAPRWRGHLGYVCCLCVRGLGDQSRRFSLSSSTSR